MQKNMSKISYLVLSLFIIFTTSCQNYNKHKEISSDAMDSAVITSHKIDSVENKEVLVKNEAVKVFFNNESETVQLKYFSEQGERLFNLGRHVNTFGDPPIIEVNTIDSHNVGIVIITNLIQMGQSADNLTFFSFNKTNETINKVCEVTEIAVHDMEIDTLSNIKHYDYRIDKKKKLLIIEEYIPYKSLENQSFKYKIKTQKFSFLINKSKN